MRAIRVDQDGTVKEFDGKPNFWMDKNISWAAGDYRGQKDHFVYYNDMAMFEPQLVRANIAGSGFPLPVWIVGADGEADTDATLTVDRVMADLSDIISHPDRAGTNY